MTSWATVAGGVGRGKKCGTDPLIRSKAVHQARPPQVKAQASLAFNIAIWVPGLAGGRVHTRALSGSKKSRCQAPTIKSH